MITLSLVVPCYNESAVLHIFMTELKRVLDGLGNVKPKVIFVNDGSRDDTLSILRELHRSYPDIVRYYSLSRNFGKEGAMLAGLTHATGDYVAIMDADLQDPPALLPDMLKWVTEEGYDCVGTRRSTREGEPPVRSFFARCFYWLINKISDTKLESGARDYKLLSRRALQALLSLPERNRFSKGLYEWIGFRTKWLEYHNVFSRRRIASRNAIPHQVAGVSQRGACRRRNQVVVLEALPLFAGGHSGLFNPASGSGLSAGTALHGYLLYRHRRSEREADRLP